MANIRLDLSRAVTHGETLTFKSPADCSKITGLKVYYPLGDTTTSQVFQFADAHGNNVGNINLFAADVLVKVIMDTEFNRAYVQNADTNAYLENNAIFKNKEWTLTPKQYGYTLPTDPKQGQLFFMPDTEISMDGSYESSSGNMIDGCLTVDVVTNYTSSLITVFVSLNASLYIAGDAVRENDWVVFETNMPVYIRPTAAVGGVSANGDYSFILTPDNKVRITALREGPSASSIRCSFFYFNIWR